MKLRRKLLLAALSTLALPVAGWLFVRQMESLIRQGQADALTASAQVVARSLARDAALLPPSASGWYVQKTPGPITLDGYGDDWAPLTPWAQPLRKNGKLLLAEDHDWLYGYVDVRDARRRRADGDDPDALAADHLVLALGHGRDRRRYLLASAAPGPVSVRPLDPPAGKLPDLIAAQWQEDGSGYRIEWRLPKSLELDRMGLGIYDADVGGDPLAAESLPLLRYSGGLSSELGELAPAGVYARLLSPQGWLLARSGRLGGNLSSRQQPGWIAALIYRVLLANRLGDAAPWSEDTPKLSLAEVRAAAAGRAVSLWRHGEARGSIVLVVAVPIQHQGRVAGVLLLEQASRTAPLLANRALAALLLASFAVLLIAGGVLLGFATLLSLRLAKLRKAAEQAQANDGRLDGALAAGRFPMIEDQDEIGDLARSFARLLEVVGGYTDYLRTLASKLSHELNTPLAIVKSSLDNLEHAALPAEAQLYLARARDGVARLGALVRAMSEASRMERAIAAAEPEDTDLREVVRGCAEAYQALAGTRRLEVILPERPLPLHCAPELLAQALDKLFDNALSFAPAQGWLRLRLSALPDGAEIALANQGPPLPEAMQGRLFESLVSLREKATPGDGPHLGLGLYVVRLVAERHGGEAQARNLANGEGVVFSLRVRGMPRPRL